jgi:2-dehydro-3-deoxyphosphogluconate aldolase / (4S)-4-hydroxy-2-oxoglutarate aldolase
LNSSTEKRVLEAIESTGIVAVMRSQDPKGFVAAATALAEGGVKVIEITMTVPNALDVISDARRELGGDGVFVGAGTVVDELLANRAIAAGAEFLVSPVFDRQVFDVAGRHDVAMVPGALTPTEILAAWRAGSKLVKVFPARLATPGFFADLRGPFPMLRLMPTGNMDTTTVPQYIAAGAAAVGIGKALVDLASWDGSQAADVTSNARMFCGLVADARQGRL